VFFKRFALKTSKLLYLIQLKIGGEYNMLKLNAFPKVGNKVLIALSGISKETKVDDHTYVYDKHTYHISDRFISLRWSKSLIKQLILYVSASDSDGDITLISETKMAEAMNVSVRTIQHNNMILSKSDIIQWSRLFSDTITVSFNHYLYDILGLEGKMKNAEERSTGFTFLDKDVIDKLLKEDDVNVLRTTLRLFALSEGRFNSKTNAQELHVFFKDLTNFLPNYVGYKAKIKEICQKVSMFFPVKLIEGKEQFNNFIQSHKITKKIAYKLKDVFLYQLRRKDFVSPKEKREKDSRAFFVAYRSFLSEYDRAKRLIKEKNDLMIYRDEIESLVSSFGFNRLKKSLEIIQALLDYYYYSNRQLSNEDVSILNIFYKEPSKGLRFISEKL